MAWRRQLPINAGQQNNNSRGNSAGRGRGRGRDPASQHQRDMELMASVSRAGGLEEGGDALKDYKTQQQYREFIQGKLSTIWNLPQKETEDQKNRRIELQENCLILFRKLREGIMASKRADDFAVEVYETSLHLSTIFKNPRQISSIYPYLFSTLSLNLPRKANREITVAIALLHELSSSFPSQTIFLQSYTTHIRNTSLSAKPLCIWLKEVAASLRCSNYVLFEDRTRRTRLLQLLHNLDPSFEDSWITNASARGQHLEYSAFACAVQVLQDKAQQRFWTIIRTSYRELGLHPESIEHREWLMRSLCLHNNLKDDATQAELDRWMEEESAKGTVTRKEGAVGRWSLVRPR